MTLKRKEQGFTIVELLIVIVVIGILAAIVLTTFRGVQQTARNTARETDIQSVHKQIEAYFAESSTYPTLAQLNDTADGGFVDTELAGLSTSALYAPDVDETVANPLVATASATTAAYGYETSGDAGAACDGTPAAPCTEYTLTAPLEGGEVYTQSEL